MNSDDQNKVTTTLGVGAVISPFTHLAGHYWPYTVDTISALAQAGVEVDVYASLPPREKNVIQSPAIRWRACAPWTPIIKSIESRNLTWGSRSDNLLRNLEFSLCLRSALRSPVSTHIHCIEARHRILLNAVLYSKRRFSALCVGSPDGRMSDNRAELYRRAFATGRLKIIVETEAVRRDWEPLAGEHVIHIPVAITGRSEPVLSKLEARKRLGLPERGCICLFFGTHREGKDYRTAINAAKLAKSHPYLLFAGPLISGNDPDQLLREEKYDHGVSWNRFYLDDMASQLFDACDAVILPYARGYAKGSAVLLQACKYGKPVIASDTGHLSEFVNSHGTGLLYEPENVESLAAAYDNLAMNTENRVAEFAQRIKDTAMYYSWDRLACRYQEIFALI